MVFLEENRFGFPKPGSLLAGECGKCMGFSSFSFFSPRERRTLRKEKKKKSVMLNVWNLE
jgi:hypothetical protein